jgi:membrane protease subunit HflK
MAWNEPGNSGRDPWSQGPSGKGGNKPPDLNDLVRRLKALWTRRRGKVLGPGTLAVVAAALALGWIALGFYTVDEQDNAVVVRLGAYNRTVAQGLHWHWPPPLEHVRRVNVTNQRQAPVQGEYLTKDLNLVDVGLTVQFRVSSIEDDQFQVVSPDDALRHAAASALQEVVAGYTIDEVLGDSQPAIAAKVKDKLQRTLDALRCGLQVTDASLNDMQPPDAVKPAFYDAIKAAEDQKRAHNDAQADADERLPKARGDAARSLLEAQAYRDETIARAEGDAARFTALLAEYRKAPQVTRKRLYLQTISDILAASPKVLVDVDKGNPNFFLPLDQLMKQFPGSADAVAAPASSAPDNSTVITVPAPPRSNPAPGPDDGARSRDRESH